VLVHLEKLWLIRPGIGMDNIRDSTTNLINAYSCEYTQVLAPEHLHEVDCEEFVETRARFNYETRRWTAELLPAARASGLRLSHAGGHADPATTRGSTTATWSRSSACCRSPCPTPSSARPSTSTSSACSADPDAKRKREAAVATTISGFRELIDTYIKLKEDDGDRARALSADKVEHT
jgi:hypothetical protein